LLALVLQLIPTAQQLTQPPRGPNQVVPVTQVVLHLAANQRDRIGAEGIATLRLVALNSIEQPKAALLKQVVVASAAGLGKASGLLAHKIEVGFNKPVAKLEATALAIAAMQGQQLGRRGLRFGHHGADEL
jgi:hypothetical protein